MGGTACGYARTQTSVGVMRRMACVVHSVTKTTIEHNQLAGMESCKTRWHPQMAVSRHSLQQSTDIIQPWLQCMHRDYKATVQCNVAVNQCWHLPVSCLMYWRQLSITYINRVSINCLTLLSWCYIICCTSWSVFSSPAKSTKTPTARRHDLTLPCGPVRAPGP